jgi:hypothetical protein
MLPAASPDAVRLALIEPAIDALYFDLHEHAGLPRGQQFTRSATHGARRWLRLAHDPFPLERDHLDSSLCENWHRGYNSAATAPEVRVSLNILDSTRSLAGSPEEKAKKNGNKSAGG